eukprot:scaffold2879_cov269-Prasinococcus_capsulatus_cf.AAC.5
MYNVGTGGGGGRCWVRIVRLGVSPNLTESGATTNPLLGRPRPAPPRSDRAEQLAPPSIHPSEGAGPSRPWATYVA